MLLYGLREKRSFADESGFIIKEEFCSENYFLFEDYSHLNNFLKETNVDYIYVCRNDNLLLHQVYYLIKNNLLSKDSYIPKLDKRKILLELNILK